MVHFKKEYFRVINKWASKTRSNLEISNHKLTEKDLSEIIKSASKCKEIQFSFCKIDSSKTGFDFKINGAYQIETLNFIGSGEQEYSDWANNEAQ